MNTVLVCKSELLPYSETFIKEQVLACARWRPVLVGTHRVDGLALDGLDVRLLHEGRMGQAQVLARKLLRELDLPAPGVLPRLRAETAQLVHVHFGTEAVALWPALRRLGLPVLVTLHGSDINIHPQWWRQPGAGPASRHYPQRLVALGRSPQVHFIAVSEAVRARAIAYGLPAGKVTVRYIGVDLNRFRFEGLPVAQRAPRILFVGRLVEKKGAAYLLEAFAMLRRQVPLAQLVMVGDGPLLAGFRTRALELGVPVEFLGRQPSAVVQREMARARVFCLPSVTAENGDAEGLGLVINEAQACGVPVVTSALGGAREAIVDGQTGFAFAERDVAALADALARVLRDDTLAERMSHGARAFVAQRFDLRACTRALEAEYDRFASASGRRVQLEGQPA